MNERDTRIALKEATENTTQEAVATKIETGSGRTLDFTILLGDITQANYDAVGIPANPSFELFPGGAQSAIMKAFGTGIFVEAEQKAREYINDTGEFHIEGEESLRHH